ncbi:MAG: ketoacyl-ACP synthase III [Desulfobacteraceae bacterium]|nr:ketoacyl-ACP synthase III [Desulfobacteraceae bacterium]
MAEVKISRIRLEGIACAVPEQVTPLADEYAHLEPREIEKICNGIGVRKRAMADAAQCTSDLCCAAAERLLEALDWRPESIDALILVTQTGDYLLPATSCTIQHRLGLPISCAALDVNLGCSGYVYGLWLLSSLLSAGKLSRGLLLAGDTISRICSPRDRATRPLFGDAGSATALAWNDGAPEMRFRLGTDGRGRNHLIVPAGGFRNPRSASTAAPTVREGGNIRSDEQLFMNGAEIFTFTLQQVPPLIGGILESSGWSVEDVDAFVMHQANSFMLKHLGKKMKLPAEKVVIALEDFGNTSSASIPLALSAAMRPSLSRESQKLVLAGFGVGYSWAAAAVQAGPLVMPDILRMGQR